MYFTDKTLIPLKIQDLIYIITRLTNEKWDEDCYVPEFKKSLKLQFFGVIAYNWKGPCYIFNTETEGERITLIQELVNITKIEWRRRIEKTNGEVRCVSYELLYGERNKRK